MKRIRLKLNFRSFGTRILFVYIFFIICIGFISKQLYGLQIVGYENYKNDALAQQKKLVPFQPERGEILCRDKTGSLHALAINKRFFEIGINPSKIESGHAEIAKALSDALLLPYGDVYAKVTRTGDPYEILIKHAPEEQIEQSQNLKIKSLEVKEQRFRYYPNQSLASHVLGFVGFDSANPVGKYGLEALYDELLGGRAVDPAHFTSLIENGSLKEFQEAYGNSGASLILTIDPIIQKEAERLLEQEVAKWNAQGGNVIVLDPRTGEIRALANAPSFDPNTYAKEKSLSVFMNSAIALRYEPGSVFKPFTVAGGLVSGRITPTTEYYDSGEVKVDDKVIRNAGNSSPKKMISISMFLQRSYNVGAVFVESAMGDSFFKDFLLKDLKFQEKTGIDLPGEVLNSFSNFFPPEGRRINFANASFGQGIALTPLKLIQEFAVFANHGILMKPYIIDEIRYADGDVEITHPQKIAQVFPAKVANEVSLLLEDVVSAEKGSGRLARIEGYRVAGKTGTGDIAREDGKGYYANKINHTFVGFAPASEPQLIILTRVEDPKGVKYAEATAVPLFQKIMKFSLDYYGIPPDVIDNQ
ncbi:MAG: Stage V sporulation protein D [Parcubacteria group bacterium GW2011_GWF1_45_5]|nr:MAG: Stage V sporulation protein D [Parcubacteria group bacterium GW2011_GWF1_45_5]